MIEKNLKNKIKINLAFIMQINKVSYMYLETTNFYFYYRKVFYSGIMVSVLDLLVIVFIDFFRILLYFIHKKHITIVMFILKKHLRSNAINEMPITQKFFNPLTFHHS